MEGILFTACNLTDRPEQTVDPDESTVQIFRVNTILYVSNYFLTLCVHLNSIGLPY